MRRPRHNSAPPWARLGVAVLLVALAGVAVCAGATDGPAAGQCRTFHDCGGREECFKGTCRCASALYSNRPPSCLQFSLRKTVSSVQCAVTAVIAAAATYHHCLALVDHFRGREAWGEGGLLARTLCLKVGFLLLSVVCCVCLFLRYIIWICIRHDSSFNYHYWVWYDRSPYNIAFVTWAMTTVYWILMVACLWIRVAAQLHDPRCRSKSFVWRLVTAQGGNALAWCISLFIGLPIGIGMGYYSVISRNTRMAMAFAIVFNVFAAGCFFMGSWLLANARLTHRHAGSSSKPKRRPRWWLGYRFGSSSTSTSKSQVHPTEMVVQAKPGNNKGPAAAAALVDAKAPRSDKGLQKPAAGGEGRRKSGDKKQQQHRRFDSEDWIDSFSTESMVSGKHSNLRRTSLFHDDDEDDDDAAARYGFFARGGAAAKGDSKGKTPPRAKEKGRDRTRSDFISVDPVKTGNADGGGGGEAVMAADKAQPAAAGASPRRDSQLLEKKQKEERDQLQVKIHRIAQGARVLGRRTASFLTAGTLSFAVSIIALARGSVFGTEIAANVGFLLWMLGNLNCLYYLSAPLRRLVKTWAFSESCILVCLGLLLDPQPEYSSTSDSWDEDDEGYGDNAA